MTNIVDYFTEIERLVDKLSEVEVERYEEDILAENRGNLCIRLRFSNNSLLEISEAIHIINNTAKWLTYRYHYQDSIGNLIFRYDNAPHHPEVKTHPDHKHIFDKILDSSHPGVEEVLKEIKEHLARQG